MKQCPKYHGHITLRRAKHRRRHSQKQQPQGWYILHHARVTIICRVVIEVSLTWQDYDPHCWTCFCCGGWRIQDGSTISSQGDCKIVSSKFLHSIPTILSQIEQELSGVMSICSNSQTQTLLVGKISTIHIWEKWYVNLALITTRSMDRYLNVRRTFVLLKVPQKVHTLILRWSRGPNATLSSTLLFPRLESQKGSTTLPSRFYNRCQ